MALICCTTVKLTYSNAGISLKSHCYDQLLLYPIYCYKWMPLYNLIIFVAPYRFKGIVTCHIGVAYISYLIVKQLGKRIQNGYFAFLQWPIWHLYVTWDRGLIQVVSLLQPWRPLEWYEKYGANDTLATARERCIPSMLPALLPTTLCTRAESMPMLAKSRCK